jgi:hypothetical protein
MSEVHGRRDRLGNEVDLDGAVAVAPAPLRYSLAETDAGFLEQVRISFLFAPPTEGLVAILFLSATYLQKLPLPHWRQVLHVAVRYWPGPNSFSGCKFWYQICSICKKWY